MAKDKHQWIDGKWACSTDEEAWDSWEQFDTEDQARQYAIDCHCGEQGQDFDTTFYTGRVECVTAQTMASWGIDADSLLDTMAANAHDNLGEIADDIDIGLRATKGQYAELESLLTAVLAAWLTKHELVPSLCTFSHVKSHLYERCDHGDGMGPDGGFRCELGLGHTGEHRVERP